MIARKQGLPGQTGLALRGDMAQSSAGGLADRDARLARLRLPRRGRCASALPPRTGLRSTGSSSKIIRTTGDAIQDRPLSEVGGKGLFTKEIEEALAAGAIDLAVHSAKDMPTVLPDGLVIAATLPREDARDVFISRTAGSLRDLPRGRRRRHRVAAPAGAGQAIASRSRRSGAARQCARRACASSRKARSMRPCSRSPGLKRLGLAHVATAILPVEEFLPAVGQGIIAIEIRERDEGTRALLAAIDDRDASTALAAERAFLAVLDGSCRTPIAGHATIEAGRLRFRGLIAKPDGSELFETAREGPAGDAGRLGLDAGRELKARAGADFFVPA